MADITRDDVATLIQEEFSSELLAAAATESAVLKGLRNVDMGTKVQNLPVLATLPEAEFVADDVAVSDDDGTKPTAKATWGNKRLVAEEIAVIIPVHENTIDDATENILDDIAKEGGAAIGRKLDGAVLFGASKPTTWTSAALFAAAVAAGQTHTIGAGGLVENDLGGSILQSAEDVDEAGWDPTDVFAPRGMRFKLANQRSTDGTPIFLPSLSNTPGAVDSISGLNANWVSGMVWNRALATALVVDRQRAIIGVRQDVTVKFLDQATVGGINLAEKDMVALRFKARYAYVLGDTRTSEGNAPRVPVAAVLPAGAGS